MTDLNKLAEELHAAAVEKGFWDVEEALNKHIAKMHSELSEAVQADRIGMMYDIERDGAKPEGVAAELADFVMMALDYFEYGNVTKLVSKVYYEHWNEAEKIVKNATLPVLVNSLHESVVKAHSSEVDFKETLIATLFMVAAPEAWLKARGYDLWDIIRQKMEYNRSRPALHGRLY